MLRALHLFLAAMAVSAGWCGPVDLPVGGSFENGTGPDGAPAGWTVLDGEVRLVKAPVRSGAGALEATDPGPDAAISLYSAHFTSRPDCLYVARAWLRSEPPARPSFYLQFFDVSGRRIGVVARFSSPLKDWAPVTIAAVPPREARTVSVLLFSGAGETGRFQADDVSLREWSLEELGAGGLMANPGFEVAGEGDEPPPGWLDAQGDITRAEPGASGAHCMSGGMSCSG